MKVLQSELSQQLRNLSFAQLDFYSENLSYWQLDLGLQQYY